MSIFAINTVMPSALPMSIIYFVALFCVIARATGSIEEIRIILFLI